ncbi:hypothetical protein Lal_00046946 [Lupinus albus]|uniref:Putative endonuclease/exonuclease/phosphatase n=1 Tax=Lupinus albus TaxID=3870 RepID=A0A6A4QXR7_LUPAL|nr:putative endonuclease/exonuclease/phosphatase [Lupinus albus]KAF1878280.1 hypothetical protein Lal_00046946 [Lupinus albus]
MPNIKTKQICFITLQLHLTINITSLLKSIMLKLLNNNLRCFFSHLRCPFRRAHSKCKIFIKKFGRRKTKPHNNGADAKSTNISPSFHPNAQLGIPKSNKPIRIATFSAALYYATLPKSENKAASFHDEKTVFATINRTKSLNTRPKSILKQSSMHQNRPDRNLSKFGKSEVRLSINLPDNEISLRRKRQLSFSENKKEGCWRGKEDMTMRKCASFSEERERNGRTVVEVLRELDADILGLQDVKAEEENGMKPLSELAEALGMNYVFAESWAPQYGNAVFSRWPIKRCSAHKLHDSDFRNVLKATIDVPEEGELNFYCTQLDHLDENCRMKQVDEIIQSSKEPHILVGGLNSLDQSDYSLERWTDIVKYYEEIGKPTPQADVMKYLKTKNYTDAKDFSGECESVIMIAKGQSVQGTCKYGTRVDYILSSSSSPYKFVPGSYLVHSSKGTSDHHIVKVDVVKVNINPQENATKIPQRHRQKVVRITHSTPSKAIWKTHT